MKKSVFKLFLSVICFFISFSSFCQNFSASYIYDANGNRTRAQVIYLKSAIVENDIDTSSLKATQTDLKQVFKDSINKIVINIYPNPTQGKLLVEIIGIPDDLNKNSGEIQVFDIKGTLILSIMPIDISNEIDLSTNANGSYILMVKFAGQSKKFIIVKV